MSDKSGVLNRLQTLGILLLTLTFLSVNVFAHDDKQHHVVSEEAEHAAAEADFNAGEMIIEHISDAYEWHIMDFGETHVSIPLPVILYDEGEWHVFMSSHFHHGHDAYMGYFISHHDINAGKIVKEGPDGHEIRPTLDISITKNVVAIFFSSFVLILVFLSVAKAYTRNRGHAPSGLQSFIEPIILFIRDDIAKASIGKHYEKYTPYLL